MSLSTQQNNEISSLLRSTIRAKLSKYSPETQSMPFHVRLLGKDRMANYSFIQSINTTIGTSIFEQVGEIVARPNFPVVMRQYKKLGNTLSAAAQDEIHTIINDLTLEKTAPDKLAEMAKINLVAAHPPVREVERPTVDLFVSGTDGTEYYFEIKTAKPNKGQIPEFKRMLLEWYALRCEEKPDVKMKTILAIPYNPYYPAPFDRWTFGKKFDTEEELFVGERFWNFLGGEGVYDELLCVFEQVGIELRPEIDRQFSQIK